MINYCRCGRRLVEIMRHDGLNRETGEPIVRSFWYCPLRVPDTRPWRWFGHDLFGDAERQGREW